MNEILNKRRAVTGVSINDDVIWLYRDGTIADFLDGLNNVGYSESSTYNKKSFEATYLKIWNTQATTGSTYNGGKSFTSGNKIPAEVIGKTIHVKGYHTNQNTTNLNDSIAVYISETVANAYRLNTAYPNSINETLTITTLQLTFTPFEITLYISKIGYISVLARRSGSGTGLYEVHFNEIWIE